MKNPAKSKDSHLNQGIASFVDGVLEETPEDDISTMSHDMIAAALEERGYTTADLSAIAERFQRTLDEYSAQVIAASGMPPTANDWPVILVRRISVGDLNTTYAPSTDVRYGNRLACRDQMPDALSVREIRIDRHPSGEKWLLRLGLSDRDESDAQVQCEIDGQSARSTIVSTGNGYLIILETSDDLSTRSFELCSDQRATRLRLSFF